MRCKPGALRNGAPFQDWELLQPLKEARAALISRSDGDRQFVGILSAVPVYGLDAVVVAGATAVNACTVSRDVVLNLLSRTTDEAPEPVETSHP